MKSNEFVGTVKTGFTNVVTNRIFQAVFAVVVVVGIIWYLGRKSALKTVKEDIVKLPTNETKVVTITVEQMNELISDCRFYFAEYSLLPGTTPFKVSLIKKLLLLTDYELGLLNNTYNQLYSSTDDNLYTEIENDWWGTEYLWRDKILTRLKALGAGKKSA